ncbi:DNA topoisomerase I [Actinobacillus equuli]|nr:DNA topoisomerase I [Actinobacillus equuli]
MRNKHVAFRPCGWLYGIAFTVEKVARGLSAGRVQSVAVKLLVEREREIKAFQPEEYWEILANTLAAKGKLPLDLIGYKGKNSRQKSKQADEAVKALQGSEFIVSEIDKSRLLRKQARHLLHQHCNKRRVPVWALA